MFSPENAILAGEAIKLHILLEHSPLFVFNCWTPQSMHHSGDKDLAEQHRKATKYLICCASLSCEQR